MDIDIIIRVVVMVLCVCAFVKKLVQNKKFEDWVWPVIAGIWCSMSF